MNITSTTPPITNPFVVRFCATCSGVSFFSFNTTSFQLAEAGSYIAFIS